MVAVGERVAGDKLCRNLACYNSSLALITIVFNVYGYVYCRVFSGKDRHHRPPCYDGRWWWSHSMSYDATNQGPYGLSALLSHLDFSIFEVHMK